MLRFGLGCLVKWKLQTKPNHVVEQENDIITSKLNAVFCSFGLSWFGLRFFYWIGSVLNTSNMDTIFIHIFYAKRTKLTIIVNHKSSFLSQDPHFYPHHFCHHQSFSNMNTIMERENIERNIDNPNSLFTWIQNRQTNKNHVTMNYDSII